MSDETSQWPTPAQVDAAGLVAVTTWEEIDAALTNGQGPLRTANTTNKTFPPVTKGYVSKPKVTPPPPPPTSKYPVIGFNDHFNRLGVSEQALGFATAIQAGSWHRDDVPWNADMDNWKAINPTPGVYNQASLATSIATIAAVKAAGMKSLQVITVNSNPGLTATWTSGPPSTPAQFAVFAEWFVGQMVAAGHAGLDYELFNEPDGGNWYIDPAIYAQMLALTYPAMKKADPTCTVWGMALSTCGNGGGAGTEGYAWRDKVRAALAAMGLKLSDVMNGETFHQYWEGLSLTMAPNTTQNFAPYWSMMTLIAFYQQHRVAMAKTDNDIVLRCMVTEHGVPFASGAGTPQTQAEWIPLLFTLLSGDDANGVSYMSYPIEVVFIYAMEQDSDYALAPGGVMGPVGPALTELFKG